MARFRTIATVVLGVALAATAGCGKADKQGNGVTATTNLTPGPSGSAACDLSPWKIAPVHVAHTVNVPPVPVVTGIRTAQHTECGYDRVVLDINGPIPGYDITYVTSVSADGSGKPISLPGSRYLQIVLKPAQAHTDSGAGPPVGTVTSTNYPSLKAYVVSGDFEGVVTVVLGLADEVAVRVGELSGRLYVDVADGI